MTLTNSHYITKLNVSKQTYRPIEQNRESKIIPTLYSQLNFDRGIKYTWGKV